MTNKDVSLIRQAQEQAKEEYEEEYGKNSWEDLMNALDVDYEESVSEIKMVVINANVIETYRNNESEE